MKCKNCKRVIDDDSIFCKWCGERQIRERKKKDEIKVPSPRQLKSGKWNIELRAEGQSITEDTAALCEAKARAIRAGFWKPKGIKMQSHASSGNRQLFGKKSISIPVNDSWI